MSEEREGASAPLGSSDTVVSSAHTPRVDAMKGEGLFATRYMLLGELGRGGMGVVYRARDTLVGDLVALKMLKLEEGQGRDLLERFRREVRLSRRISHPNVARTHDLGEHDGHLFLTMEYVEGENLQSLLTRERRLAAVRAARITLAVCEGLAAAHAAGVVHRDLKPANVLVEAGGRVVLTDFGIARAMAGETAARTQGMVGTPMYISPEQLEGGELEARSDLYAAGLLLYEMLTGEAPFTGESVMAVAFARLRQPPPDPAGRPGVPDALAQIVRGCVAKTPKERPSGASEVAAALRSWLISMGETVDVAPALVTPRTGASSSGPLSPLSTPSSWERETPSGTRAAHATPRTTPRPMEQSLAFLPIRFVGPPEQAYLGDALTEGVIDLLARTRGVRVQSSGATARFRNERDPRVVGRELGVEFVADGTVQRLGPMVRTTLRLVDGISGTQLWSGRFEDSGEDLFEMQDRLAQRLAEALRVELLIAVYRASATPDVIGTYRQALSRVHSTPRLLPEEVIKPLEESIEQAPGFLPAVALHAVATMRTWFMRSPERSWDWMAAARASVERASRQTPDMVETLLAKGMLASQQGDWRVAVVALRSALDVAPTYAPALQYLGNLQCEAGRVDEGMERLRLAYALNPALGISLYEIARCNALRGKWEDYRRTLEQLMNQPFLRQAALLLRMRVATWMGNREELQLCRREIQEEPSQIVFDATLFAAVALGEADAASVVESFDTLLKEKVSPRFASMMCQLATEVLCVTGHPELAVGYFLRAADSVLIDLEWLDRCPALASLRPLPAFTEGRRKVRVRVESIWAA